ncbi:hypothetical protein Tco_0405808 [Tanacetum coccineum]
MLVGGKLIHKLSTKRSLMKKAFQDLLHELGEVNPTHSYYNGSRTSKDNKDPSWNTNFQDQENSQDNFIPSFPHIRRRLLALKCKGKSVETKFDKPSVVRQPNAQRIPKPSVLGKPTPFSDSLERKNFAKKKSVLKTNESEGLSKPITPQNLPQTATQAVRNTNVIKPGMYRIASSSFTKDNGLAGPQPRSNQMKDKVVPNTSHVKFKKTEVEEHLRISSISNQTKFVTACNDSLNSRTSINIVQLILFIVDSGCTKHMTGNLSLLCNFVENLLGTVRFSNDKFALILGYGDLVQGNITIKRVYYVEKVSNHRSFHGWQQFCDANFGWLHFGNPT